VGLGNNFVPPASSNSEPSSVGEGYNLLDAKGEGWGKSRFFESLIVLKINGLLRFLARRYR
jgi:hypothetical protein